MVTETEYSKEALQNISTTPRLSLKPYARLQNIVQSLRDAQPAAEGAAPHLVDYVEKLASALREQMKGDFTNRLQKRLEQMKWPSRDLHLPDDLMAQWRDDVELLLDLQTPYGSSLAKYRVISNFGYSENFNPAMWPLNSRVLSPQFYSRWK